MSAGNPRIKVIVAPVYVNGCGVVREMARKGAYVVAVDTYAAAPGLHSRFAAEKAVVPNLFDNAGGFASWLLARKDLHGAIVIPTDDFFLRELYNHRAALEKHFTLCIPAGNALEITLSKALTAEAVAAAGIEAPKTRLVANAGELSDAAEFVGFPALVKPVFSISFNRKFGTKSFVATNRDELDEAFAKSSDAGEEVVIQEIIPGGDRDVAVSIGYWDCNGNCVGDFEVRKSLQFPPLYGVGQVVEVVDLPEVRDICRRLLKSIGFAGAVAASELKCDPRDGKWKFIEINARTPMQVALARPAGCDILEMLRRDKLGLPQIEMGQIRKRLRWIYMKNGILRHAYYPEHRLGLVEYARLYMPPFVPALFSVSDPRPFFADMWPLVKRNLKATWRDERGR